MLQIIGWLGCVYLLVKGLELIARPNGTENREWATLGAIIAIPAAFIFAYLFYAQASAAENLLPGFGGTSTKSVPDYSDPNVSSEDINQATNDAVIAADNAMKEADEALRAAQKAIDEAQ